jgi:hexulose-6-phosphate isomerase
MIKSISAWAFEPSRPAEEVFQLAKSLGFEAIELALGAPGGLSYQVTPESTEADCAKVREQVEAAGLKVASLCTGDGWRLRLTSSDEDLRRQAIEATKKQLKIAQWLGAPATLCVPGGVGADFIDGFTVTGYDAAYDNALSALQELKPVAEETGVALGVENVWNKFLLSPLEFRDFLDKVGSPKIGCYFDTGNVVLTGYPEQWVSILGSRITRVHFKDFKKSVGTIDGFCDLLDGDVDYPAVMAALRGIGYDGPVTAEFFNCEADLPKISAAMDKILAL